MHRRPLARSLALLALLTPATASAVRPDRVWGTYYGGTGSDYLYGLARDGAGNLYVVGRTTSASGLATPDAWQTVFGGGTDAYLAKFTPDGQRVWGTYLGGPEYDEARGVAVDGAGAVVVTGYTFSATGIATPASLQPMFAGLKDMFVVKFDAEGQRIWGTYIGGPMDDAGSSVAIDADDNIYVAGNSNGALSFALPGPHDTTPNGLDDIILLKLAPLDGAMVWGTYFGGDKFDYRPSLAIAGDAVYFAAETRSEGLATDDAFDLLCGAGDAVVARFDSDGFRQFSTYFGGDNQDIPYDLVIAPDGDIVVAGNTTSTSGIATPGAHQTVLGGSADGFVVRLDKAGAPRWGTYLGGAAQENLSSAALDPAGNVLVVGQASSAGLATPNAYKTVLSGLSDGVVAKFDALGAVRYVSYFGGASLDHAYGSVLDGTDGIYLAGFTSSYDSIATPGAHQSMHDGGTFDGFLVRFGQGQGDACAADSECEAGFCTDGVCCEAACGGDVPDCQVCGAGGLCGVQPADTPCRDAGDECDVADVCDGVLTTCLPDVFVDDGTACSGGECLAGLCIDPGALPQEDWGTYAGATGDERGGAVATDAAGNLYLIGTTASLTDLATPGTHQPDYAGGPDDVFLLKFTAAGERIWGTYLGGPGSDAARALAVDPAGNVVVVGTTTSTTGIASANALQTALQGPQDGFAALFTPAGQRVWGTYLGSAAIGDETTQAAAFDSSGDVHVAGAAAGALAFALPDAHNPNHGGGLDAYWLQLTRADSAVVRGTYYGADADDLGTAIAVDAAGVLLGGITSSPTTIATPGAYDETLDGPTDGFATRFDPGGPRLWGTYLGGEATETNFAVVLSLGSVSATSTTDSTTGIATVGAHQENLAGGTDAAVWRLDGGGAALWATYLGGPGDDTGAALSLDALDNLVLAGTTTSSTGISTADAVHPELLGGADAYVVKFDGEGSRRWGTYVGGAQDDTSGAYAVAARGVDDVYVAGTTTSTSGVATQDALFQPVFGGGGSDVFLVHLTQDLGDSCQADSECESGSCVDGVCCETSCGGGDPGDCEACSVALGATKDGTCAPLADMAPCDAGMCMAGACIPGAGTTTDDSTTDDSTTDQVPTSGPTASDSGGGEGPIPTSDGPGEGPTPTDSGVTDSDPGDASGEGSDTAGATDSGCGCHTTPGGLPLALLALLALPRRRRP